jgi:molybdenum cofactor guanylyltransferase
LAQRKQANGVAAHINGLWQTFPAVYHKNLLPSLRNAIDEHRLQMQRVLSELAIRPVTPEEIRHIDPDLRTFTNINTPSELEMAQG